MLMNIKLACTTACHQNIRCVSTSTVHIYVNVHKDTTTTMMYVKVLDDVCVLWKDRFHTDVVECLYQSLNNCTYICVNTIGSYYCICEFWYSLDADRKTCESKLCKLHSITDVRIPIMQCQLKRLLELQLEFSYQFHC